MSRNALIGICMTVVSLGAIAQDAAEDHSAHHPANTPAASATEMPAAGKMDKGQDGGCENSG